MSRDAGCLVSGCRDSETSADACPGGDRNRVCADLPRSHPEGGELVRHVVTCRRKNSDKKLRVEVSCVSDNPWEAMCTLHASDILRHEQG